MVRPGSEDQGGVGFRGGVAPKRVWPWVALWAGGIFLSLVEARWLVAAGQASFAASQIKASSFMASGAFLVLLTALSQRGISAPVLQWLGARSYPIYLGHILAMTGIIAVLPPMVAPVYAIVVAALTLLVCAVAIWGAGHVRHRHRQLLLGF